MEESSRKSPMVSSMYCTLLILDIDMSCKWGDEPASQIVGFPQKRRIPNRRELEKSQERFRATPFNILEPLSGKDVRKRSQIHLRVEKSVSLDTELLV
jgi:hypothetical protein